MTDPRDIARLLEALENPTAEVDERYIAFTIRKLSEDVARLRKRTHELQKQFDAERKADRDKLQHADWLMRIYNEANQELLSKEPEKSRPVFYSLNERAAYAVLKLEKRRLERIVEDAMKATDRITEICETALKDDPTNSKIEIDFDNATDVELVDAVCARLVWVERQLVLARSRAYDYNDPDKLLPDCVEAMWHQILSLRNR